MKTLLPVIALGVLAGTAARAGADSQSVGTLTREQVTAEAIRARHDGEILEGRSSLTPREITPGAYPARPGPTPPAHAALAPDVARTH